VIERKEARRDLQRNDVADRVNEINTKRRMERDKRRFGRNRNSNSNRPTGSQVPDAIPESDVIDMARSDQPPQTPIHNGSVASTLTSSPESRFSMATTAASTPKTPASIPKTPGPDDMRSPGADKDGKVSYARKAVNFFKTKEKADKNAPLQRKLPPSQTGIIVPLPSFFIPSQGVSRGPIILFYLSHVTAPLL
jgi:hypothetical protein